VDRAYTPIPITAQTNHACPVERRTEPSPDYNAAWRPFYFHRFPWKSWISVELTDSTEALERCGGYFTLSTGYSLIFFLLRINLLRFIFRAILLFLKAISLFPQYRKQGKKLSCRNHCNQWKTDRNELNKKCLAGKNFTTF
jgi:hypothetical protein